MGELSGKQAASLADAVYSPVGNYTKMHPRLYEKIYVDPDLNYQRAKMAAFDTKRDKPISRANDKNRQPNDGREVMQDARLPGAKAAVKPSSNLRYVSKGILHGASGYANLQSHRFGALFKSELGGNELVISIRGTQTKADWVTNFRAGYVPDGRGSLIHSGFDKLYRTMRTELTTAVARNADRHTRLHFVGHSLGGALATLAVLDLKSQSRFSQNPCHLYTFGAPRLGLAILSKQLAKRLESATMRRVYDLSDPVPWLPLFPYMHPLMGMHAMQPTGSPLSFAAHSMDTNYLARMPATGWPSWQATYAIDPRYWLTLIRGEQTLSGFGLFCLSTALRLILAPFLAGAGIVLQSATTILDVLTEAMATIERKTRHCKELVVEWTKTALHLLGRYAMAKAVTASNLTKALIRFVLEMIDTTVRTMANVAIGRGR